MGIIYVNGGYKSSSSTSYIQKQNEIQDERIERIEAMLDGSDGTIDNPDVLNAIIQNNSEKISINTKDIQSLTEELNTVKTKIDNIEDSPLIPEEKIALIDSNADAIKDLATQYDNHTEQLSELNTDISEIENTLSNKQDIISDLNTIRQGAAKGATSIQSISHLATKTELSNKVDKVSGKQLSTNDFTTALKTKLENSNVYKHQFRALSALPASGDGWYSIASIGDTESSIVQISSGGHTDVQVAINTGWEGNTTGSLTVLNSFIDDANNNHAYVKAVRLRKIPNSNNGVAVLEAKINRTGYYSYAQYVNIIVSVFTNAGHNIITTNSEYTQTLQLVNDDSNVLQEFTLTDKAIMAKNIVAETVNADNIIENIVVNGKTYPAAKSLDLGNIQSEGLTISGAIINGGNDIKSITSNSIRLSSKSGLYLSSENGTPVLELGPLLGYKDWQIAIGTGLERNGNDVRVNFNSIIGTTEYSYFRFDNAEPYITYDSGKLRLDLSKLAGSGIILSTDETPDDGSGPYNWLWIGGYENGIDNPLTFQDNRLFISTYMLISTASNSMIQVPDNMVDYENTDSSHITLKVPNGAEPSVAVNGGLVVENGELKLATDIIGDQYGYQIRIGSGLQAGTNNWLRVNPRDIIGSDKDCTIIVPSENFTRDSEGKAHLIFNTGISKDELDSAIDARLKELGLIE